jgi:hypothetical protein
VDDVTVLRYRPSLVGLQLPYKMPREIQIRAVVVFGNGLLMPIFSDVSNTE